MKKLSPPARRVLAAVDLDASIAVGEIARRTGLKPHTANYQLQRLFADGILKDMRIGVNRSALGLTDFVVYMRGVTGRKKMFIDAAQKEAAITWLGELAGDYQWGMTISASSPTAVQQCVWRLCDA